MLLGGQLMSIGFLAELFIAYHSPDLRSYSICERTLAKRNVDRLVREPPIMNEIATDPNASLRSRAFIGC